MAITTTNYFDRTKSIDFSNLPEPLRKSHELVKKVGTGANAWDNYHASAQIRSMIDLYFEKLDAYLAQQKPAKKDSLHDRYKDHPSDKARAAKELEKKREGTHPYIFFYNNNQVELYATGLYAAKQQAIAHFKVPKSKEHMVHGQLAVEDEPTPAAKPRKKLRTATPPRGRGSKGLKRKPAPEPVSTQKKTTKSAFDWTEQNLHLAEELRRKARFAKGDEVQIVSNLHNVSSHEKQYAGKKAIVHSVDVSHNGKKPHLVYLLSIGGEGGNFEEKHLQKPPKSTKAAAASANPKPAKAKPAKQAKPASDGVKRTKVKKHGNANMALPVSHYTTDVALCRRVLGLTVKEGKHITRKQVKSLHSAIEKAIVERRVRKSDPHAKLFADMASTVAAVLRKMTDGNIESVEVINFSDKDLLRRIRDVAESEQVRQSVNLLRTFINLQATTPQEKTVQALIKSMSKHQDTFPNDANNRAVGAAVAVLRDWQPGKLLRITTQQLSGLSGLLGLGCPDTDCDCTKKAGR